MAPFYAAMRERMVWLNARTGRVICQCAARVNLFFDFNLGFLAAVMNFLPERQRRQNF